MWNDELTPDAEYLRERLLEMLAIPSPTGFTDELSHYVCAELTRLQIPHELTRRGTIVARLAGDRSGCARAVVNHLDTIGAVVTALKANGRLGIAPLGTWSSRFAEGGRVTIYSHGEVLRGQVLPVLASGHAFNEQIDQLPVSWDTVEVRLNAPFANRADLEQAGITTGAFVNFDSDPEISQHGFITARHLDNKAGASALLAALKLLARAPRRPEVDFIAVFTVTEEVGTGASASLPADVAEMVGIDIGPVAPGQNARETGVTLCAQDTSGPFDRHLLSQFKRLCREHDIDHQVDLFRYYYSDANSAVLAGRDVRDALLTFGTDATHGYERTHLSSLTSLARLLAAYAFSPQVEAPQRAG
jgi:peptidase M42 family hydrolase